MFNYEEIMKMILDNQISYQQLLNAKEALLLRKEREKQEIIDKFTVDLKNETEVLQKKHDQNQEQILSEQEKLRQVNETYMEAIKVFEAKMQEFEANSKKEISELVKEITSKNDHIRALEKSLLLAEEENKKYSKRLAAMVDELES